MSLGKTSSPLVCIALYNSTEAKLKSPEADLDIGERYADINYALSKMIVFYDAIDLFCNNTLIFSPTMAFKQSDDESDDDEIPALEGIADNALGVGLAGRKVRAKL
ncbi:hypothetical protein C8F04DRAFT_1263358 [Mycena alexandri]|uniref:Uncharacterized protein n=1 Tax=Mycena alexandri TaxID=1745969 RepID=A0AAD6SN00_9AGAR|nr:hypothetical protein C8F04DRAFT_1263358 [Mycena alexandri]